MHPVLITGANGQLGRELIRQLPAEECFPATRKSLDITDAARARAFCHAEKPGAIVNCAAYTAVDAAESDPETAFAVNRDGPANLAAIAAEMDIPLVHISTDFVFDGTRPGLYTEDDPPNPLGVYGQSKLAGEQAVLAAYPRTMIIRTSWLYSGSGKNFVHTILKVAREKGHLRVVADQTGSPTWTADLAQAIQKILPQVEKGFGQIYHYSNLGLASWYDFAVAIVKMAGIGCHVEPIESHEFPTSALRPPNSAMNTKKIRQAFGLPIPYWRDSLQRCIDYNLK